MENSKLTGFSNIVIVLLVFIFCSSQSSFSQIRVDDNVLEKLRSSFMEPIRIDGVIYTIPKEKLINIETKEPFRSDQILFMGLTFASTIAEDSEIIGCFFTRVGDIFGAQAIKKQVFSDFLNNKITNKQYADSLSNKMILLKNLPEDYRISEDVFK